MMRKILFRGKRVDKRADEDEWVYGVPFFEDGKCFMISDLFICDEYQCTGAANSEVIPETVGQYIGLNDKDGQKIFEGDMVTDSGILYGRVIFATPQEGYSGMSGFMVDDVNDGLQDYNGFWHMVEVIGNIHDNPELLEVQNE